MQRATETAWKTYASLVIGALAVAACAKGAPAAPGANADTRGSDDGPTVPRDVSSSEPRDDPSARDAAPGGGVDARTIDVGTPDVAGGPEVCRSAQLVVSRNLPDAGDEIALENDPFKQGRLVVQWAGDLNDDHRIDLIIYAPEMYGSGNDAPMGVLVGCDAQRFVSVFPTGHYAFALEVSLASSAIASGERWRELIETERVGTAGPRATQKHTWRFDGTSYTRVKPSTLKR